MREASVKTTTATPDQPPGVESSARRSGFSAPPGCGLRSRELSRRPDRESDLDSLARVSARSPGFKSTADAVAGRILEQREYDERVVSRGLLITGNERPARRCSVDSSFPWDVETRTPGSAADVSAGFAYKRSRDQKHNLTTD